MPKFGYLPSKDLFYELKITPSISSLSHHHIVKRVGDKLCCCQTDSIQSAHTRNLAAQIPDTCGTINRTEIMKGDNYIL